MASNSFLLADFCAVGPCLGENVMFRYGEEEEVVTKIFWIDCFKKNIRQALYFMKFVAFYCVEVHVL